MKTIIAMRSQSGVLSFPTEDDIQAGLLKSGFRKGDLNQDLSINKSNGSARFSVLLNNFNAEAFDKIGQNIHNVRRVMLTTLHKGDGGLQIELQFDTNL